MTMRHWHFSLYLMVCICLFPVASFASEPAALFSKIKFYAAMASVAYLPEQEAKVVIEAQAYQLDLYNSVPAVEVNYFVATNHTLKHHVISVRGTANVRNALVDVSMKLLYDEHANIMLHQGFAQAAEGVYKSLLPTLNKDYTISATGHSLGGAVAVILAMYLDIDQYALGPVVTFGQPKVTNVSGAFAYQHLDVTRVVTAKDLVPLLPPLDVMDIKKPGIYWHLGNEVVLLEELDYATLEGLKSMMRATRVINATLSPENLVHHKMVGYLSQIELKGDLANLVPYETDIDLLKLFGKYWGQNESIKVKENQGTKALKMVQ